MERVGALNGCALQQREGREREGRRLVGGRRGVALNVQKKPQPKRINCRRTAQHSTAFPSTAHSKEATSSSIARR